MRNLIIKNFIYNCLVIKNKKKSYYKLKIIIKSQKKIEFQSFWLSFYKLKLEYNLYQFIKTKYNIFNIYNINQNKCYKKF